jgi:hypothetical protein
MILACGMGSASWVDTGLLWTVGSIVQVFTTHWSVVVALCVALAALATVAFSGTLLEEVRRAVLERHRLRPVPRLDNPVAEGALDDVADGVTWLRRGDATAAAPYLSRARQKLSRCAGRLSKRERAVVAEAWRVVKDNDPLGA